MSNEGTVEERVAEVAGRARVAATDLALATRAVKDAALLAMADALVEQSDSGPRRQRRRRGRGRGGRHG